MRRTADKTVAPDRRRPSAAIDRRALLKASLLGGSVAGVVSLAPALVERADGSLPIGWRGDRPKVSAEMVEWVAEAFFGYDLPKSDGAAIARTAESMLGTWHSIELRHLSPIDPPFDFSLISAEAERLGKKRK